MKRHDLELEELRVPEAVGLALQDADLGVGSLEWSRRDAVVAPRQDARPERRDRVRHCPEDSDARGVRPATPLVEDSCRALTSPTVAAMSAPRLPLGSMLKPEEPSRSARISNPNWTRLLTSADPQSSGLSGIPDCFRRSVTLYSGCRAFEGDYDGERGDRATA